MPDRENTNNTAPPFETESLRRSLTIFLDQEIVDPISNLPVKLGNYKYSAYAFYDYDGEPIYVGQTNELLRTRVRRHLTNQRTDAVAMKVLDPFEVHTVEVWPLPQYQSNGNATTAKDHLNWLENKVFQQLIQESHFKAILNEKDPPNVENESYELPKSYKGCIVSDEVFHLRSHPDTRIARRSETLSLLAKVINERQVNIGLRRTLLTQAKRMVWLAEQRLSDFPSEAQEDEDS